MTTPSTYVSQAYIKLTGYYPRNHVVYILGNSITVIAENATNPNSTGSIVYTGGAELSVTETPDQILKLISAAIQ